MFNSIFMKTDTSLDLFKNWHARHSAGSLVALDAYFEAPERIAALIFVAPAILAPLAIPKIVEGDLSERNNQTKRDRSDSNNLGKPLFKLFEILSKFTKYVTEAIMQMIKRMGGVLNSLYKKALSSILRSALGVMLVLTSFWMILQYKQLELLIGLCQLNWIFFKYHKCHTTLMLSAFVYNCCKWFCYKKITNIFN